MDDHQLVNVLKQVSDAVSLLFSLVTFDVSSCFNLFDGVEWTLCLSVGVYSEYLGKIWFTHIFYAET